MSRTHVLHAFLFVSAAALSARAADIVVPTQQPTIQAAINAAASGDVVQVLPGVYTGAGDKDLDFGGKPITVRRANNSGPCTIDCQGNGRAFIFDSGETSAAVVEGVTIANGHPPMMATGGGILCTSSSSPTFRNCIFRGNVSSSDGGGAWIVGFSSPTFLNCHFVSNFSFDDGGAVHASFGADPVFINCVFSQNAATDLGGAIGVLGAAGAIPIIINCSFTANEASNGGAIYREGGDGGGSFVDVRNSVLWGDLPNELGGLGIFVEYSIVESGWPGDGILESNPSFIDPNGADNISGTVDDNLRVSSGSPAIDAASNGALSPSTPADLAGGPRFRDDPATPDTGLGTAPIIDIGAYEYADCPLDATGDSTIGFAEVTELLLHWGPCPAGPCAWDSNGDGTVGFADFTAVLLGWGSC